MPPKIAIATCADYPALTEDERGLPAAMAAAGIVGEPVQWRGDADWTDYDGVLLRSPWDYFEHAAEFLGWLGRLEREGVPCWNSPALVRWNLDKNYLGELAAKGVATVPTLWVRRAEGAAPEAVVARILATGWLELVLKPTISAGAWRTLRMRREEVASQTAYLREVLAASDLMAQPFMPEVLEEGEYSFLFFDGVFSHAVLKRAKPGDFRVQWTHGGRHVAASPERRLFDQARAVLDAAPEPGLYARVDGIVRDGRFLLMELEQIEPYLFFGESPGSLARFVAALRARL